MIVCHCNCIDHVDIERAAADLTAADTLAILTPVLVYKALGKRPRCGGCLSLASSIIHSKTGPNCASCPFADMTGRDLAQQSGVQAPYRRFVDAAE